MNNDGYRSSTLTTNDSNTDYFAEIPQDKHIHNSERTMPTLVRSRSVQSPTSDTPPSSRIGIQRTNSQPSTPSSNAALPITVRALMEEFIRKYVLVWDVDLPAEMTPTLQEALALLPQLAFLFNDNSQLTESNLKQVLSLVMQMKNALPMTIDPKCSNIALHQHNQVLDLLNRATKFINDAIIQMNVRGWPSGPRDNHAMPIIRSSRQILGTAVILVGYFDKVI